MKTNRFIKGLIASIGICIIPSAGFAGQYTATYNFESPDIKDLGNGKQILMMKDAFADIRHSGAPVIPAKFSNIYIPKGEQVVDISVSAENTFLLPGLYNLAPTQTPTRFGDVQEVTEEDPLIYKNDSWYPGVNYQEGRTRKLRGTNIYQTRLFPVQYNPVNGSVEFSQKLTVTIETETLAQTAAPSSYNSPSYRNINIDNNVIRSSIDNADDFEQGYFTAAASAPAAGARDYVVITTAALASAFQTLTDYRETAEGGGYSTYIETIDQIEVNYPGRDRAEKIRNFIIDQYNSYGTQFVLLGGDADGTLSSQQIPTRGGSISYGVNEKYYDDNIPSDYYYACLDGDWNSDSDDLWGEPTDGIDGNDIDWDPEVSVGRIPADTIPEALNHINKIIAFENLENPSYKSLMLAERLDSYTLGGDSIDYVHFFSNKMPRQKLYDRSRSDGNWDRTTLVPLINSNQFNMINHLGHSSVHSNMRLNKEDVSLLTNSDPLLIFSEGCYSGSFDNRKGRHDMAEESYFTTDDDSIAEELTVGSEHGAFAYIGNSRYGWYYKWSPSLGTTVIHSKFVKALIQNEINPIGTALGSAKAEMDYNDAINRWNTFEVNLLGDPASKINRNCQSTDLILTNKTAIKTINVGEPILLKAQVGISCSNALYGQATVTAEFDNGEQTINLHDDGTNGDEVAGDKTYSATWTPQYGQNPVWITVTASDPSYNSESENFSIVVESPYICEEFTSTNSQHETASRAYSVTTTEGQTCYGTICWGGTEVTTWHAQGSDNNLGTNGSTQSTLHTEPDDTYAIGVCPTPDVTPPVVTMFGDNPMTIYQGSTFVDPGATAIDDRDGDITANIIIQTDVNTNVIGQYSIHYIAIDAANNAAIGTRPINVVAAPACEDFTDTVSNQEAANRAYSTTETTGQTCYGTICWGGTTTTTWYAQGSDENLGTSGSASVTLKTNPSGSGFVTGECSAEPQPPVIENLNYTVSGQSMLVTVDVTDQDSDLQGVHLKYADQADQIWCDNTGGASYTCDLAYHEAGTFSFKVTAIDLAGNSSETSAFTVEFVEASGAPVIENLNYTVSGQSMIVTVDVTDQDGDLQGVYLDNAYQFVPILCDNTGGASYTCNLAYHETGTFSFKVTAKDFAKNSSETSEFTVEFVEASGECVTDTNFNHVDAGRAYVGGVSNLYAYGVGSDDDLGLYGSTYYSTTTSLEETSTGVWSKVSNCP